MLISIGIVHAAVTDGLVAYYPLDEASGPAIDALNMTNLTEAGTMGTTIGHLNNARGPVPVGDANDYLYTTSLPITFSYYTSFTITGWVNLNRTNMEDNTNMIVFSTSSQRGDFSARLEILRDTYDSSTLTFYLSQAFDNSGYNIGAPAAWGGVGNHTYKLPDNIPIFFAATYDGYTHNQSLYINDVFIGSAVDVSTIVARPVNTLYLFRDPQFASNYAGAINWMDEVTIHNRVLSQEEITDIRTQGIYGNPCTPNWTCSGYGSCLANETHVCNAVTDLNTCGVAYGGDYSEFSYQYCGAGVCHNYSYHDPYGNPPYMISVCGNGMHIMDINGVRWWNATSVTARNFTILCRNSDSIILYNHSNGAMLYNVDYHLQETQRIDYTFNIPTGNFDILCNSGGSGNGYMVYWDYTLTNTCNAIYQCSNYGSCTDHNTRLCTNVTDTQSCGFTYGGDLSEFTQSCNFCNENWVGHNSTCNGKNYTISYTDVNNCALFTNDTNTTTQPANQTITCSIPSESSGHTRYLVDANGNVVGTVYNNQLVTGNTVANKQFSLSGQGSAFDIIQWLKDLWKKWFG